MRLTIRGGRNTIERMDEPLSLLREICEAYEGPLDREGKMRDLVKRGRLVLEEFKA